MDLGDVVGDFVTSLLAVVATFLNALFDWLGGFFGGIQIRF